MLNRVIIESGIRNIPVLLAVVLGTILSGAGTTALGYVNPFMIAATILTSIGAGLLTTWDLNTGPGKWIGYQVLIGVGIGLGLQLPLLAIQTVLEPQEIPVATALVLFMQLFGAAVFVSVGQSILTNRLVSYVSQNIPGIDTWTVAQFGATALTQSVPPQYVHGVDQTYNDGLVKVFFICVVMGCCTAFESVSMEWKSVKGKKTEAAAA